MSERRNIQIIDDMPNCAYDIFSCTKEDFERLFPDGINIQFIEDLDELDGVDRIFHDLWNNPVRKPEVTGIHGTLFYGLEHVKKKFYPRKRESDLDHKGRGWAHGDRR